MNTLDTTTMLLAFLEKFLKMAFGADYYELLMKRVKTNDAKNIFSIADLAQKYPDFKDRVIQKAKSKIKKQSENLDQSFEDSITKKYMGFDQGLQLLKGLLDGVVSCGFGNTSITDTIIRVFTSAVCTDGVLWFKEYHNGYKLQELYEVEKGENSESFSLFYLHLEVTAKKIENFLYNESNTTLKAKYKVIKFSNLQALLEWASD